MLTWRLKAFLDFLQTFSLSFWQENYCENRRQSTDGCEQGKSSLRRHSFLHVGELLGDEKGAEVVEESGQTGRFRSRASCHQLAHHEPRYRSQSEREGDDVDDDGRQGQPRQVTVRVAIMVKLEI